MRFSLNLSFIICLLVCITACKKNQLGGKSTITGVVAHHGTPISNAVVYIKFNTSEFPGANTDVYDTSVSADSNGNYSINFYKGSYYIYAVGLDMDLPAPYTVSGGFSLSIKNKEYLTRDIAVTED